MTWMSPLLLASFGNISSPRLFACSFSMRFMLRLRSLGGRPPISSSAAQRPVPQLQRLQLAELGHRLAVRADAGHRHVPGHGLAQAVVPAADDEARGQALDVPLPRRRQRLVEVVDGEDDPPLRGGEPAEVAQVRVAAALDPDPGGRRRRQVGRHRQGRAAVERERGAGPCARGAGAAIPARVPSPPRAPARPRPAGLWEPSRRRGPPAGTLPAGPCRPRSAPPVNRGADGQSRPVWVQTLSVRASSCPPSCAHSPLATSPGSWPGPAPAMVPPLT